VDLARPVAAEGANPGQRGRQIAGAEVEMHAGLAEVDGHLDPLDQRRPAHAIPLAVGSRARTPPGRIIRNVMTKSMFSRQQVDRP
jgi:hypothetical protein